MNSFIESLNVWGGRIWDFALPMFWQSGVLIVVVLAFDFMLRRKIRAAVRYSLWFVVFLKLLLPPTLALPTGAAWWLRGRPAPVAAPRVQSITVNYSEPVNAFVPPVVPMVHVAPPAPKLTRDGWLLVIAAGVSVLLGAWVGFRWRYIARCVSGTTAADADVSAILEQARRLAGVRRAVRLRVTAQAMSPAVCGLFRPVILLPQSLIEKLTENQLRAVLLHELIHLQRRDVWVNCAQTLLQIVYWWHPLLWVANARVRRVREEAVDDAVMCALSDEAEVYAPTLLEVAKLAFSRPLASLGLVGILESRNALRQRIERLLNFTTPRRAGVSMVSVICLAAFTALAVPMGEPPARSSQTANISDGSDLGSEKLIPYRAKVNSEVFTRNLKARAEGTMHTTNDDLNAILASVVDGFGVDCTGERAVTFNAAAGEVTAQNTSEALGVLDEVVRELNLSGGEHVLNPPHALKQVLIEAQFYLIRPDDFQKLGLDSGQVHREDQMSPWWDLSADELTDVRQRVRGLGVENLSSPRIQTAHGITASLFIGDGTNNIQLECVPFVHDGLINLTTLARTTGKYAPGGKGWPDFAGHTNCAIFSRMGIPDGAGVVLRADNVGTTTDNELIVLVRAQITGAMRAKDKVPFLGDLPGVGRFFRSPSNAPAATASNLYTFTFRLDVETLTQRLAKFASEHNMQGVTNRPTLLVDFLANAGVNTYPSRSFLYREENGQGNLTLRTTQEDLRKAAEVLSSALPANGGLPLTSGFDFYNTNYTTNANSELYQSKVAVAQLVQDGKLLYQLGKMDEAELKLSEALAKDPNNQTALYYLSQIKRVRSMREQVDTQVPKFTSPARQKIYEKLNSITFDKVSYPDMPLSEVVRNLAEQTRRRDPDQNGINSLLNRAPRPAVNFDIGQPSGFDPTTGQPISQGPDIDLAAVKVRLDPGLTKVRLIDVLEAITKSADHPITYAILDYGIEFTLKAPGEELHTRTFNVDMKKFFEKYQVVATPYGTNADDPTAINITVLNFFNEVGVNLAQPKSFYLNDRLGKMTVHATDKDLERIQSALEAGKLAVPPAPVVADAAGFSAFTRTFKLDPNTFFMALEKRGVIPPWTNAIASTATTPSGQRAIRNVMTDSDASAFRVNVQNGLLTYFRGLGVDLQAPKSIFFDDRQSTLTVRATEGDLKLIEATISTLNREPSEVTVKARFVEVDKELLKTLLAAGVEASTNNTQNRILTEEQFRPMIKGLEKRDHADLLNEGQVTTLSGRQAQFQVVDVETIVWSATNKTPPFDTRTSPFGTFLDVVPRVTADGDAIALKVIPSITQFLGYEDTKTGKLLKSPFDSKQVVVPKSRLRRTAMDTTISDGDTLLLTDFGDEWVSMKPDGTEIQKPYKNEGGRQLVVFITPTIIDRAGNRVHAGNASARPKVVPATAVSYETK